MLGLVKSAVLFGLVLGLAGTAQAQAVSQQDRPSPGSSLSTADDCTIVEINVDDVGKTLTEAERAALMDKAFYESLARFDRCQAARPNQRPPQTQSASGIGAGGGGGGNATSGGGEGTDSGKAQSMASQSIQGAPSEQNSEGDPAQSVASQSVMGSQPAEKIESDPSLVLVQPADQKLTTPDGLPVSALGSGKLPEDIPAVDNDTVLEKQIRAAAKAETDPAIREKLWNEYRKYKGLPLVKTGQTGKP